MNPETIKIIAHRAADKFRVDRAYLATLLKNTRELPETETEVRDLAESYVNISFLNDFKGLYPEHLGDGTPALDKFSKRAKEQKIMMEILVTIFEALMDCGTGPPRHRFLEQCYYKRFCYCTGCNWETTAKGIPGLYLLLAMDFSGLPIEMRPAFCWYLRTRLDMGFHNIVTEKSGYEDIRREVMDYTGQLRQPGNEDIDGIPDYFLEELSKSEPALSLIPKELIVPHPLSGTKAHDQNLHLTWYQALLQAVGHREAVSFPHAG